MTPAAVAEVLAEIARLGELAGENPFRTRAFAAAARAVEAAGGELAPLAAQGRLTELNGVGPAIAETIAELLRSGRSTAHEELRAATPPGLYDVLRIPGLGNKKVRVLHAKLGVDSLDSLERAARDGRIAGVSGFGAKTEARILEGIAFVRSTRGRRRLPDALDAAERLAAALCALPGTVRAEAAGEVRRRMETVGTIDLVAACEDPSEVAGGFARSFGGKAAAGGAALRLQDGLAVRLRCVQPVAFGLALLRATGSEAHLRDLAAHAGSRGTSLDAVSAPDEAAVFAALGLPPIPAELREGDGEVEAAATGRLPELVSVAALRGTFHCHTVYSDGTATVADMAEGARSRGWDYLGLADHSRAAAYAGGLSRDAVRKQHREIDAWNAHGGAAGFRIYKGIESDILPNGNLDYDDALLAEFDYVVGSVHSGFGIGVAAMTERLIRAVRNPYLTMLGHPTGRLLLVRDAYPVDVRAVIDAAAEAGVAIELNADPHRLDLDWRHLRYATARGVPIAINPDAHSVAGLESVRWGVEVGRKGWLAAPQVLNTWTLDEVERWFAQRKSRRPA